MDDMTPPEPADINESDFGNESRPTSPVPDTTLKGPQKKPWYKNLSIRFQRKKLTKKDWIIAGSASTIILICGIVGATLLYNQFWNVNIPKSSVEPLPKATTEPSRLTGLPVDPELNKRPITGIMIENSPDARPQSGLLDAGIVVEAIAEGGITRFLALYQESQPSYIGPVRSVRPYYLDFALPFQAAIAHVGGSPDALKQIKSLGVRDLDQFANSDAYWRVSSRYAPHNMYTDMKKLDVVQKRRGYTKSDFTSLPRKNDQKAKTPKAKIIDFSISSFFYNTRYAYDAKHNYYLRSEGGAAHRDEKSRKQLKPKVVIALVMSHSIASDGKHSVYGTTGKGSMFIFQDGVVIKGTWVKKNRSSQISFLNSKGQPVRLNAGQTWITLVGASGAVSYKP